MIMDLAGAQGREKSMKLINYSFYNINSIKG